MEFNVVVNTDWMYEPDSFMDKRIPASTLDIAAYLTENTLITEYGTFERRELMQQQSKQIATSETMKIPILKILSRQFATQIKQNIPLTTIDDIRVVFKKRVPGGVILNVRVTEHG